MTNDELRKKLDQFWHGKLSRNEKLKIWDEIDNERKRREDVFANVAFSVLVVIVLAAIALIYMAMKI
jgi:phosphoenolpyruvate carboxylase